MRITILTAGSRGDTQPYIALGVGLKQAGYEVHLAASENFGDWVSGHGLTYHRITGDFQQILAGQGASLTSNKSGGVLAVIRMMREMVGPLIAQMAEDMWAASQGTDAVLSAVPLLTYEIATRLNVPYFPASLFPFAQTRQFPQPFIPVRLPCFLNGLTYKLGEQAAWQMFSRPINRWRVETLGLPPAPFTGPFAEENRHNFTRLYGFSPQVIPPPADWPDNIHVTGYWMLNAEAEANWQPPADLAAFLDAGPPPVFIGFGSMPDPNPAHTTQMIVEALQMAGQRGIISRGWAKLGEGIDDANVFLLDFAPYEWLFRRVALVVHHGGAGTTGQGARAGVPTQIVPYQGDQFFWAWRLHEQGIGMPPLPRKKLTVQRLADAIQRALGDGQMQHRAAEIGKRIRAEDGVGRAVDIINQILTP